MEAEILERLKNADNPYTGGSEPLPSYRAIHRTRREAWAKENPSPDAKADPYKWERYWGARIASVCKDKGIKNNASINAIRNEVLKEAVEKRTFEVGIWAIFRRIVTPRLKALNFKDDPTLDRGKRAEMLFYKAGYIGLTRNNDWRKWVTSFETDDKAVRGVKTFLDNNAGYDEERLLGLIRASLIPVPPQPTPEQIAELPDVARQSANRQLPQTVSIPERLKQLKNAPDSDKLDDWFPRDKKQEATPMIDQPMINGTPVDELEPETFEHELDPAKAIHAIPNHMAKTYGKDGVGKLVNKVFGMPVVDWLKKNNNDVRQAWGMVLDFEAANPIKNETSSKQPQISSETTPNAISTPNEQTSVEIERSSVPGNIIPMATPKSGITTLTGIDILDIPSRLNEHLPPQAYGAIQYGQMSGKTDLDGDYIRVRLDEVYGAGGWRIAPNPTCGRVELATEQRKDKTWYICRLVAHTFQYAVNINGVIQWTDGSTTSDQHDNTDEQYAQRGAMTSLMKQFYRLLGGMDHIYFGEYDHEHAKRELAQQKRKAS